MKIIKGIFCSFLAIIFSLVLLITCVLGILNKTISRESIMKNVEKVNIYGEIKESIEEISKDYVSENTEEIFKQFVSEENVKIIIDEIADSLYEDKKVNFSKEFLNISKELEEKLIESLIYTLTEIDGIKEIMIFIDNEKLEYLPQTNMKLPNTLNREFGINKLYDITNIKNLTKTTIYYIGKEENISYYVPVTKVDNNNNNKIEIIINELKSSPIYETNLISYLASSVELLNYETLENQIYLSFNNQIFEDFNEKNIQEEVKYSIALSLKDTFDVDDVVFKVDNEIITSLKKSV